MAFSGTLLQPDHLLLGAEQREHSPADGVDVILERPEDNGVPHVIVLDNEPGDHAPIYISSDEEDDDGDDDDVIFVPDGDRMNHQVMEPEDEDTEGEDSEGEDEDDSDYWSEDSGYDSMSEEEEEEEDQVEDDEEDNIRARSPLNQELAEFLWQGWILLSNQRIHDARPPLSPPPVPVGPPVDPPPVPPPVGPVGPCPSSPGPPSVPQSPAECVPSTSGLGSSSKREREESSVEQVSMKRQRRSDEDSAPSSSSGLSSSTNSRFWLVPSHHTGWSEDSDSD